MNIDSLFDRKELDEMLEWGFVRTQDHPRYPLRIFNYTQAAQFDQVWNDVTRRCRGLIVNSDTGEIVARPFEKFQNYAEHDEEVLPMDVPVEVTDKMDGSLGILYGWQPLSWEGTEIATRGSFTSDQAAKGTELLHRITEKVSDKFWAIWDPNVTFLFEILYPENRIVVDYGQTEELVLLGAVENDTGVVISASEIDWPGSRVEQFTAATLAEALLLESRPNREGVVVRFLHDDMMVKIKQEDYVHLHRIMTGLNARNIWEVVAAKACEPYITKRHHWGSYVGFGWERAEECLALGDDWLEGVPDEFYEWIRETTEELQRQHDIRFPSLVADAIAIRGAHPDDAKRQYEAASRSEYVKELMAVIRNHNTDPLFLRVWRELEPAATAPFARSEDVA